MATLADSFCLLSYRLIAFLSATTIDLIISGFEVISSFWTPLLDLKKIIFLLLPAARKREDIEEDELASLWQLLTLADLLTR
jgi:hypothetical protein